ncbi:MAG: DUF1311 domain-containing protein, partial [Rhodospirillales bacterium]|nr:DUF1311 domain-containing protein [Rhodospirillales bacterium]
MKLRAAERAWIKYRDGMCDFAASGREGGSSQGMVIAMCRTEFIWEQAKKLSAQIDCRTSASDCSSFGTTADSDQCKRTNTDTESSACNDIDGNL